MPITINMALKENGAWFSKLSLFVHAYQLKRGAMCSLALPLMLLPSRLMQISQAGIPNLIGSQIADFLMVLTSWICVRFLMKPPDLRLMWIRVVSGIFVCTIISAFFFELSPFDDSPNITLKSFSFIKRTGLILNRGFLTGFILIPVILFFENIEKEKRTRTEMEKMVQKVLASKLNSLRQEVNPHFLFNSLNVLQSGSNEEWVKSFVLQLSSFYRYLLKHNNGPDLELIDNELQFILAYIHILKERFENGLIITTTLSQEARTRKIPVLALQILVENAVKHNIISCKYPLQIHIYDERNHLVVSNNRQRKRTGYNPAMEDSGIGLINLEERYNLITNSSILVAEGETYFTVKIPMI